MIMSPKKSDRRPLEDIHNVLRSPISERGLQVSDHDENRYANPSLTPKKRRLGSSIHICENDEDNLSSANSIGLDVHKVENHGEKLLMSRLAIALSPNFNSPQAKVKQLGGAAILTDDFQSPKSNSKKRKDVSIENRIIVHDDLENTDPHSMKSPMRIKVTHKVVSAKSIIDQKTPEIIGFTSHEINVISENTTTQSSTVFNGDALDSEAAEELASADHTYNHVKKSQPVLGDDIATFPFAAFNSLSFEGLRLAATNIADLRPSAIDANTGSRVGDDACLSSTVATESNLIDTGVTGPEIAFVGGSAHAYDQKVGSCTNGVIDSMEYDRRATPNARESDTDFSYAYILRDIERMKLQRQLLDDPNGNSSLENLSKQPISSAELDSCRRNATSPQYGVNTSSTSIHLPKPSGCKDEARENSPKKEEEIPRSTSQNSSSCHYGHASVSHSTSSSDTCNNVEVELESSTCKVDPVSTSTQTVPTHSSETHPVQHVPARIEESEEDREDREFSSFRATIAAARESSLCVLFRGSRGPGGQGLTQVQQQAVAFHKSEVDFLSSSAVLRRGEVLAPLGTQGGDTTVLCNPRLTPQKSTLEDISCDMDLSISGTVVTVICTDDQLSQSHYLSTRVPLSELNAYQEKVQSWKGKYKTTKPSLTSKHYTGYLPHSAAEKSTRQGAAEGSSACASPVSSSTPSHTAEGEAPAVGQDAAVIGAVAAAQEYPDDREPSVYSTPSPSHLNSSVSQLV